MARPDRDRVVARDAGLLDRASSDLTKIWLKRNCIVCERERPARLPQKCILVAQALAPNVPKDGARKINKANLGITPRSLSMSDASLRTIESPVSIILALLQS
jgi:hypothetical protein